jgi:hypothetical protein
MDFGFACASPGVLESRLDRSGSGMTAPGAKRPFGDHPIFVVFDVLPIRQS